MKEYNDDYSKAVEMGRQDAAKDPNCHFIDDEDSEDLFYGYATAATRLKRQLEESGIKVDEDHPLFVYLPCGLEGDQEDYLRTKTCFWRECSLLFCRTYSFSLYAYRLDDRRI